MDTHTKPQNDALPDWRMPTGVERLDHPAAKAAGHVPLTMRFRRHEQSFYDRILAGFIRGGQYRPDQLRVVHDPGWQWISIFRVADAHGKHSFDESNRIDSKTESAVRARKAS